jgi:hypothetical protein
LVISFELEVISQVQSELIPFASNKCCQSSTSLDLRKAMSIGCAKPAQNLREVMQRQTYLKRMV